MKSKIEAREGFKENIINILVKLLKSIKKLTTVFKNHSIPLPCCNLELVVSHQYEKLIFLIACAMKFKVSRRCYYHIWLK